MTSRRSGRETSGDEMGNLEEQMQKLSTGEKRDINILLLGETGVGKSTFINSFCNYLRYVALDHAMKGELTTLIPAKFTITDENYEEQTVHVGEDTNEFTEVGASATQMSRSYVFPIRRGKVRVRLIDTPGVGDTRGIDQDNINFENILSFLGEINHLNAICILLKPNNSRLTVIFEFCIKHLLSRLEKSASKNLIFVFTNSRSTFYRPGETLPALKKLLEGVNSVDIPVSKDNIFCTDNEAFRFLAAVNNGIKFSPMDTDNFAQSWKKSAHECWRMITYIAGDASKSALEPHQVKNTISVNEARRLIVQLAQPLAEIAQLIQDNICMLQRHKAALQLSNITLSELRQKLYVPVVNLRVTKLDQPTTVCASPKCSTVYRVGEMNKWHYQQKCHSPCHLRNVPKEIVGAPELLHCAAMSGTMCQRCQCSYQLHMHIYYETETYEDRLENEAVKSEISDKQVALIRARNLVAKIERRVQEYGQERETITKTTAKFACFLKANAIAPYNDAYQGYLQYLIDREKSMGDSTDYDMITQLRKMLREYTEEKNALNNAMSQSSHGLTSITADDIINCVQDLYSLKHSGTKIQELFAKQKSARKDENQSETREYVHEYYPKKSQKKRKKNKAKNQTGNYADTTDSEYATDHGPRNYSGPPSGRQNFNPNQRQGWKQPNQQHHNQGHPNQNHYQGHRNQNQYPQGNQHNPAQYLQIRQDPSGQFDLRFGQTNHNQGYNPQAYHQNGPPQNFGQQGARPRQFYNQGCNKPKPRSHSPNPRNQYRGQGPNNPSGPFNPGLSVFNSGAQKQFNSIPPLFNHPIQPPQFASGPRGFQGPRRFNQNQQPFNSNPPPYSKFEKDQKFQQQGVTRGSKGGNKNGNIPSDSGCESAGKDKKKYNKHPTNVRQHYVDVGSSESSSESSDDDDAYMSCHKF